MSVLLLTALVWFAQEGPVDPERARLEKELAELDVKLGDHADVALSLRRGKICLLLGRRVQAAGQDGSGNFEKSIADLTPLRHQQGNDEPALWLGYAFLCLADARGGRGREAYHLYDNAKGNFDIAWTENRKRPETFVGRGQAYLGMGGEVRLRAALDNFDVAVKLEPKRAAIWRLRARTLQGLGRADEAAADAKKADELEPPKRPAAVTPELEREIADLIAKLGDDTWEVREKATQRLAEIGDPARPALEKAAKSDDPEVELRAKSVICAIVDRQEADGLFVPIR